MTKEQIIKKPKKPGFKLGIKSYGKAFGLLFRKKLWWFLFFPLAINIILFFVGYEVIGNLTEYVKNWLMDITSLEKADFYLAEVVRYAVTGVIWLLFRFIFFFVFTYYGGYIVLAVLSPVFAILSEKAEKKLTGKEYPFSGEQWMRDMIRGIGLVLRNMFIQTGIMLAVFIVSMIPVIGWIAGIISSAFLFLVSSYFYGFSFMDYNSERHRMGIKASVHFIRKYKWVAIGNGSVFALFLIIPWCGMFLSGFAAIVATVAATIAVNEIRNWEASQNTAPAENQPVTH
jgi:CysZ protein